MFPGDAALRSLHHKVEKPSQQRWHRRQALLLLTALSIAFGATAAADTVPQVTLAVAGNDRTGAATINRFTLRFSAEMVALGDPRAAAPAYHDCKTPAKGRWIDTRTWVLEFDAPLPGGLRCHVTLNDKLRTADGLRLAGEDHFLIDTGGPTARAIMAGNGRNEIEEDQIFELE